MKKFILPVFAFVAFSGFAQSGPPIHVPITALTQLEELKELTKDEALTSRARGKMHAEENPELNRWLVIGADDFVRVTRGRPTAAAYLACLDRGLARLAPLMHDADERQQVAEFYQELMEMVGLESSEGRLLVFVNSPGAYPFVTEVAAVVPPPVAPLPTGLLSPARLPAPTVRRSAVPAKPKGSIASRPAAPGKPGPVAKLPHVIGAKPAPLPKPAVTRMARPAVVVWR